MIIRCCQQKTKLNTIEILISKALIDLFINHDKFVSLNNVLMESNEIKEEIKNPAKLWIIPYKNKGNLFC